MGQFKEEDLKRLAKLCRIECTDEELKNLTQDLTKILAYVELLQEVDTADLVPYSHMAEQAFFSLREDVDKSSLPREVFLSNAPDHVGGMIRVPPVIKKEA